MSKGQAQLLPMVAIGVIGFVSSWLGTHVLNSPAKAAADTEQVASEVKDLKAVVGTLCNDYGQTVSRMDQNIQNIGNALKVPVVIGKTNIDPCKR